MTKIEKKAKYLTYALYGTLGAIGFGFLLLIIGFIAGSVGMVVFGILFFLAGIAGAIVAIYWWIDAKRNLKLYDTVVARKHKTIPQIAKACDIDKLEVRRLIDLFIRDGDLEDYIRVGEAVVLKTEYEANLNDAEKRGVAVKCNTCGASFLMEKETDACPYCGNYVTAK